MIGRALAAGLGPFREVASAGGARGLDPAYRTRVLVVLTAALALDYADRATVGALGPDLQRAFHIGNTKLGLVASAFGIVGAVGSIPAGILADRFRRTVVLGAGMLLWALAMAITGAAATFVMLLGSRVFLGAVTATARPTVASTAGDVFDPSVRARALGLIDSGELVGNGAGFLVAGVVAALLGWREVFWLLALAGVVLAVLVLRLREPPRTGRRRATAPAREVEVEPDPKLVLEGDQSRLPVGEAVRYLLRIRTNVVVIVAVAFTALFFSAIRVFGVVFITRQYGIGRSAADLVLLLVGVGALVGMLAGGRVGDALHRRGRGDGRLTVGVYGYLGAAAAFVPTLFLGNVAYGLPPAIVGAAFLIAPTAPLDAVRLDIVHPQLRGRAEATRNVLQIGAEAGAPLLFGVVSDHVAGGGVPGMRAAYLAGLALLLLSALALRLARRSYPRDAAAAAASGG